MQRRASRSYWGAFLGVCTALGSALPARAEMGARLGLTGDPDQVHVGLQFQVAHVAPRTYFYPSFELGAGDDLTLFAANMDILHVFHPVRIRNRPYIGAGPALYLFHFDGNDNTEVGLNLFGGIQTPTQSGAFFGELRLGLADSPDFKFSVGWLFR